jgi:DNA-directed RNA polymerase subunit RPC12/RpoP
VELPVEEDMATNAPTAPAAPGQTTSFTCQNCGATTSAVALGTSIRCPFCGSEHVIAGPEDPNAPKPEALIPFAVPDDQVDAAYRKWLGEGLFRPKDVREKAVTNKLQAVYVPIWECRGSAYSDWTATAGYDREEKYTATENGQQVTKTRTETDWRPTGGTHSATYDRELVSGSKGLPQDWLDKLGDFDWGALTSYQPEFLLGREVETSVLDQTAALDRVRGQIEEKEKSACAGLVPGDRHKDLRVDTRVTDLGGRLLYLPAWLAAFQYNGKQYRCVVNGQSGVVKGEAPVNTFRVVGLMAAVVAVIAIVVLLIWVL